MNPHELVSRAVRDLELWFEVAPSSALATAHCYLDIAANDAIRTDHPDKEIIAAMRDSVVEARKPFSRMPAR